MAGNEAVARRWLENFAVDPRRVIYDRLHELVKQRWAHPGRYSLLDVGSGGGQVIRQFREVDDSWTIVGLEKMPDVAAELRLTLRAEGIQATIIPGSILSWVPDRKFDLATMIMTSQYLDHDEMLHALIRMREFVDCLVIDVTNPNSLYGWWTRFRKWKGEGVHFYSPRYLECFLEDAGYVIKRAEGVGFITPLSLKRGFKWPIVPTWFAKATRFLDKAFPRNCHFYYVECQPCVSVKDEVCFVAAAA